MLLALASFSRLVGQAVSQEGTCMQAHTWGLYLIP